MRNMEKWLNHEFSTGSVAGKDYLAFQRDAKAALEAMCVENGIELHKFLKNHYEFSAVLKNCETGKLAYVSISDVRFFRNRWATQVLYRTMEHEKDWTGGMNRYCTWEQIGASVLKITA